MLCCVFRNGIKSSNKESFVTFPESSDSSDEEDLRATINSLKSKKHIGIPFHAEQTEVVSISEEILDDMESPLDERIDAGNVGGVEMTRQVGSPLPWQTIVVEFI